MKNRKQLIVLLILLIIAGVVFYRQFMGKERVIERTVPKPEVLDGRKDRDIIEGKFGVEKYQGSMDEEYVSEPEIASAEISPDKKVTGSEYVTHSAALSAGTTEKQGSAKVLTLQEREIIKLNTAGMANLSQAVISPAGDRLLVSTDNGRGLSIYMVNTGSAWEISEAPGSGYGACWSPDGRRVAFKEVNPKTGEEQPMIYEVETGFLVALDKAGRHCGIPVFLKDGLIGLTAGNYIYLYDEDLNVKKKLLLEEESSPAAFSPDGKYSAVANGSGVILVDLESEDKNILSPPGMDYRDLKFSPNGKRLVLETVSGELSVTDLESGNVMSLGRGSDAQWLPDDKRVVYMRNRRLIIDGVNSSEIIIADIPDGAETSIFKSEGKILSSFSLAPETKWVSCVLPIEGEVRLYSLE